MKDAALTGAACRGRHILADFYGVRDSLLRDRAALESVLRQAAAAAGAQVLSSHFHRFQPAAGAGDGVTGVILLAESHLSIHTWPESRFAAADIFMCGAADPRKALDALVQRLSPEHQRVEITIRGFRENQGGRSGGS